jgi:hypothetical protein
MKKEADVKAACKKLFAECDVWFYMPVMNGFGVQGIPDFLGACNGHMFAVETKFGYNKPTEIQQRQHHRMRGHKVPVWVVSDRSFTEFAPLFKEWCDAHR